MTAGRAPWYVACPRLGFVTMSPRQRHVATMIGEGRFGGVFDVGALLCGIALHRVVSRRRIERIEHARARLELSHAETASGGSR